MRDDHLWARVREFTPDWLRDHPQGAVVRFSTTLQGRIEARSRGAEADPLWRVPEREWCTSIIQTLRMLGLSGYRRGNRVCARRSEAITLTLWPQPGSDFPVMQKIKQLFDPKLLLIEGGCMAASEVRSKPGSRRSEAGGSRSLCALRLVPE